MSSKEISSKHLNVCMLSTMYPRFSNDTRGLMVSETIRNLLLEGCIVDVVSPNSDHYPGYEVLNSVRIHRFNYFYPQSFQRLAYGAGIPTNLKKSHLAKFQVPFFAASFLCQSVRVARKSDIIHAQWFESGFIGILTRFFIRKPVVVTVRRVAQRGILRTLNKFVLKHADYIIFNSSYTQEESLKIFTPKNYSIVHNSVDIEKFKPFKSDLKQKLGIDSSTKVILFLGLLVEKKGLPYLLKSFKEVLNQYEDVVLVIGGAGTDFETLNTLAKELGIFDKVLFLGEVLADSTPSLFNIADVFVLPSIIDSKGDTETLGVVLLEAMACGVPVVASRIGGIPNIVDNKVGLLVEQKDVHGLTHNILRLLTEQKLHQVLRIAGREKILHDFSPQSQVKKTMEIYQKVLEHKRN